MLKIHFGSMPEEIYNTSIYFDNTYLDNWLEDDLTRKIIKGIDKATVISPNAIDSKALGIIPVTKLSGGTKTLILLRHKPENIYNISTCGDNCAKWILKIAEKNDITVTLHHVMDFGDKSFCAEILNNGKNVKSMKELLLCAVELLNGGDEE